ncbi:MAG: hypothetical protein GX946_04595 [Oligosphaeraceae bacterium]|nr:hypothetical protein [Oligosphaeraceae bacterium]
MSTFLRFNPKNFTIILPPFYASPDVEHLSRKRIFNFEAVTLPCRDGIYPLVFRFHENCGSVHISFDHARFHRLETRNAASLEVKVKERMLKFDFEAPDWQGDHPPLEEVLLQTKAEPAQDVFSRLKNMSAAQESKNPHFSHKISKKLTIF